jgi:hypothetical protein
MKGRQKGRVRDELLLRWVKERNDGGRMNARNRVLNGTLTCSCRYAYGWNSFLAVRSSSRWGVRRGGPVWGSIIVAT